MAELEAFNGPLQSEDFNDGIRVRLLRALRYVGHRGDLVIVPDGFVTDLASIPRCLWPIFPPRGRYNRAAVVHDYLYGTHHTEWRPADRLTADRIFREAMVDLGVWRPVRWCVWLGVRLGGVRAWSRKHVEIMR